MFRKPADSPGFTALPEIESSRHDGLCYLTGNIGPSLLSHQLASHCLKVTELGNNLQLFTLFLLQIYSRGLDTGTHAMQSLPFLLLWERGLLPDEHGGHHCQQIRVDNLPRTVQLHLQQDQYHPHDIRCLDVFLRNDLATSTGALGNPGT